jgi:hypothetical protein
VKTLLLEMPVAVQHVCQPFPAHSLHRNAIDEALAFVGAGSVQLETGEEGFSALGNHQNGKSLIKSVTFLAACARTLGRAPAKNARSSDKTSSVVTILSGLGAWLKSMARP